MKDRDKMKKLDKMPFINVIILGIIVILWYTGTETFVGGLCNYWRCIDFRVMIIPILSMLLLLGNIMYLLMKKYELEG